MELTYRQVQPQTSVKNGDFGKGLIDFNWSVGGKTGWIPKRSYFRIGVEINGAGGAAAPNIGENVALADAFCGNLFSNVIVKAGGQDVSSLMNYCGQANMLKTRIGASAAWLDTVGKQYGYDADFESRVKTTAPNLPPTPIAGTVALTATGRVMTGNGTNFLIALKVNDTIVIAGDAYQVASISSNTAAVLYAVAADVAAGEVVTKVFPQTTALTGGRNKVYFMWQPPVGFFSIADLIGSGDYRVTLNPNSSYKTSAVETLLAAAITTDFDFKIDSMELYVATVKADLSASSEVSYELKELQVQSKVLAVGENQLDFTIPPSTQAVSVFIQGSAAGTDTRLPPSMFKALDGSHLKVKSLQLSYANMNLPATRWGSSYDATTQQLSQRYHDSQLYSGAIWNEGGCESMEDWMKRGPIYHYTFHRDKDDRSTHLQVAINVEGVAANAVNLFVVAHFNRKVDIRTELGFISEVVSKSA